MIWKIYFWFFVIILISGYTIEGINEGWDVLDLLISSFALMGFFLYAYKKRFLSARFWKSYFLIYIIWDFTYNFLILPKIEGKFEPFNLVGLVFVIPVYIALYLYAFKFLKPSRANTSTTSSAK